MKLLEKFHAAALTFSPLTPPVDGTPPVLESPFGPRSPFSPFSPFWPTLAGKQKVGIIILGETDER